MSIDDDQLRELGKQLPYERPDADRREAVRSSLLVAATSQADPSSVRRRWLLVGGGFAAGALAAAAIAIIIVSARAPQGDAASAATTASDSASATASGSASAPGTANTVASGSASVSASTATANTMSSGSAAVGASTAANGTAASSSAANGTAASGSTNGTAAAGSTNGTANGAAGTASAAAPREAHARIDAPVTAKLQHTLATTAAGTDEVVRVRSGVVRVAVPAMAAGDRVRMQTSDAEVEGTGTYEVAVVDDRLARITVRTGSARLTVHVDGRQQQVFLATGQTWRPRIVSANMDLTLPDPAKRAPVKAEETTSAEAPRMPAVTELEPVIPAAPSKTKSPTETHFQAGWALLRAGKAREAAIELGAAADAGGDEPLAADARYFQAVALVRAGQGAEAERVLVAFLDHAPTSLRRGRAAILLGKLLRDRGDAKSARAWFESALGDRDPAIGAAAKAHLEALSSRR